MLFSAALAAFAARSHRAAGSPAARLALQAQQRRWLNIHEYQVGIRLVVGVGRRREKKRREKREDIDR